MRYILKFQWGIGKLFRKFCEWLDIAHNILSIIIGTAMVTGFFSCFCTYHGLKALKQKIKWGI